MRANEHREYWTGLPLRVRAKVIPAVFFTFVSVGFASDLLDGVQRPIWWVLGLCGWFGLLSATVAIVVFKRRQVPAAMILAIAVANIALFAMSSRISSNGVLTDGRFFAIRWRLMFDAVLWLCSSIVGYILLLRFITTEGAKHVRTRAELELAAQMQEALAPPLSFQANGYEIHGRSLSSSQMGGDVLDAVPDSESVACYLADVSGHGIQAGVFMAMVKSSVRTALLHANSMGALLTDLNAVLGVLKGDSTTYVTFACVRCHKSGEVEYSLAGHGPILHYQRESRSVVELAIQQFPLGMFAASTFDTETSRLKPGDRLLLLTDGVTEVTDSHGDEFGIDRLKHVLIEGENDSLASLLTAILTQVRTHGPQTDDQTLLLVQMLPESVSLA